QSGCGLGAQGPGGAAGGAVDRGNTLPIMPQGQDKIVMLIFHGHLALGLGDIADHAAEADVRRIQCWHAEPRLLSSSFALTWADLTGLWNVCPYSGLAT